MNRTAAPAAGRALMTGVLALCLPFAGCVFDSEPEEPGFPGELAATVSLESQGPPVQCKCMTSQGVALVAAGTGLAVIDLYAGEITGYLDTGLAIDDIADSDVEGCGYALAGSAVYPVDLAAPGLGTPFDLSAPGSFMAVSPSGDRAWVSLENDSLAQLDLTTMEVTVLEAPLAENCQGLASGDNDALFAALGNEGVITGWDTGTWSELGRVSVPGEVIDLFPGPSGYVCAITGGSNELWFIRTTDCKLHKMITFPETPSSAASMPDGLYAFASCANSGLLVVAENGETLLRTMDFGLPVSIDITQSGDMAVLASQEERKVYILVR